MTYTFTTAVVNSDQTVILTYTFITASSIAIMHTDECLCSKCSNKRNTDVYVYYSTITPLLLRSIAIMHTDECFFFMSLGPTTVVNRDQTVLQTSGITYTPVIKQ